MSLSAVVVGGGAFALLWTAEALFPLIHQDEHEPPHAPHGRRWRNIVLAVVNAAVTSLAFGWLLSLTLEFGRAAGIGPLHWLRSAAWSAADAHHPWASAGVRGLTFALAFCVLDLWHYVFHVMAHKIPLLWRFHVVHHNDPHVDVTTANRFHFGEIAIQQALSLPLYLLLGVGLFELLIYNAVLVPLAMFHHANLRLPPRMDRWLRRLIVTPNMHFVHHSQWVEETDSNYSAVLSIWDRLFGTYRRRDPREITYGLNGYEAADYATLRGLLTTPLHKSKATLGEPSPKGPSIPLIPAHHAQEAMRERRSPSESRPGGVSQRKHANSDPPPASRSQSPRAPDSQFHQSGRLAR